MTVTSPGKDTAASVGTIITCGVSHAKGSYVEVEGGLAFDARNIVIDVYPASGFSAAVLGFVDIAVDPAGGTAYAVVVENLLILGGTSSLSRMRWEFPLKIAASSSIAIRGSNSSAAALTFSAGLTLSSEGSLPTLSKVTTIGATLATSSGIAVDPGATINTKGAYVEFIASTAEEYHGILVGARQANATATAAGFLLDVATGAGGSEVVKIPNLFYSSNAGSDQIEQASSQWIPNTFPVASRLACAAQCSINDATDRLLDHVVLYMGVNSNDAAGGGMLRHPGMAGGLNA